MLVVSCLLFYFMLLYAPFVFLQYMHDVAALEAILVLQLQ